MDGQGRVGWLAPIIERLEAWSRLAFKGLRDEGLGSNCQRRMRRDLLLSICDRRPPQFCFELACGERGSRSQGSCCLPSADDSTIMSMPDQVDCTKRVHTSRRDVQWSAAPPLYFKSSLPLFPTVGSRLLRTSSSAFLLYRVPALERKSHVEVRLTFLAWATSADGAIIRTSRCRRCRALGAKPALSSRSGLMDGRYHLPQIPR